MTQKRATPTITRRRVGAHLRFYREHLAKMTSTAAAKAMGWDNTRLARIERGLYRVSAEEVMALCKVYGVSDELAITKLAAAAEEPPGKGFWTPYDDVAGQAHLDFVALEAAAERTRVFVPTGVPALAQTPAIARELMATSVLETSPAKRERMVALRMARQQVLTRQGKPIECQFLVPEYAFFQKCRGGTDVMKDQLRALLEASRRSNIEIRVLELSTFPHGGHFTFTLLEFEHPWHPLVNVDNQRGGTLLSDPAEFASFAATFDQITEQALPVEESRDCITQHLERISK